MKKKIKMKNMGIVTPRNKNVELLLWYVSSRQSDYFHEAMEFIRTKIATIFLNICICDPDDIDQDDDSFNFVNHLSDMSDGESDEELDNSGGDNEAREEASSMIV